MDINELPLDELIKLGIMNKDGEFSKNLSKQQEKDFLDGGTLLVERGENKYIFNLNSRPDGKMILNKSMVDKDFELSKELDNSENRLTLNSEVYSKQIKGYGEIMAISEKPFLNDPNNETKTYILLQDEKGRKYEFWGEENLKNKLLEHNIGDRVQIGFKGIERDVISQNGNQFEKNENIFEINKLEDSEKGIAQTKLFAYNEITNQIVSYSPKPENVININGYKLSEQDREELEKGGQLSLPDGSQVRIDPNATNNENRLSANQKKLIMATVLIDGGLTATIIIVSRAIIKQAQKHKDTKLQNNNKLYESSLNKMLSFLNSRRSQYPTDVKIANDINIVSRELSKVSTTPDVSDTNSQSSAENLSNKGSVNNIHVNDLDLYDDIERREKKDRDERDKTDSGIDGMDENGNIRDNKNGPRR